MIKKQACPNRLEKEKSPYLRQHAYNPVDWWPWCEEVFEKAEIEDKPVFLSIGYSTCHWCHVMERESFEDADVAAVLNTNFISIKLDREERPDIDSVYMHVTQMLTGGGGWPMTVFMDCKKRPFFAGTYFPKKDGRHGLGFLTLLERLNQMWRNERGRLLSASREILSRLAERDTKQVLNADQAVQRGYRQLQESFDPEYGGFGEAPKFPSPHNLMFLLRFYHMNQQPHALQMVEKTLESMLRGGIWDHVGSGFSRYSTDQRWLAPHFEKMLYDNALLAVVYSEAYLVTKKTLYRRVAEEIFEYVLRDMAASQGAFFSAEDADSEGEEGRFYTFTKHEVMLLLGKDAGEKFCKAYDISEAGNFEGKNILNLIGNENYRQIMQDDFYTDCRHKLYAYREKRIRPLRDEKILASWNGLMIYALAYAGRVFDNADYIGKAKLAADFVLKHMTDMQGKLYTRYCDGEARFDGLAEDYAYVVMGLTELYQASFEVRYLSEADRINRILINDFYQDGALYQTGKHAEQLITRPRELYDGALPSYNSVSIANFIRLAHLCDAPELIEKAEEIVHFFGSDIDRAPMQFTFALAGILFLDRTARQIIITGDVETVKTIINSTYQPFATLCHADEELAKAFAFYKSFLQTNHKTEVYLCEGNHCEAPIDDVDRLQERLFRDTTHQ